MTSLNSNHFSFSTQKCTDFSIWPCLGLDTSTRHPALVLFDPTRSLSATSADPSDRTHGQDLIPAIQKLLADHHVKPSELKSIAVGIGPGSYTGLRVGIAIIKTMADLLNIPVFPVDSMILPVLALDSSIHSAISISDAQRGEVYISHYIRKYPAGLWVKSSGPSILPWNNLKNVATKDEVLIGPGLSLITKLGKPQCHLASPDLWYPSAQSMFTWLASLAHSTSPVKPANLEPLYIRPSAAEEKRAKINSKT